MRITPAIDAVRHLPVRHPPVQASRANAKRRASNAPYFKSAPLHTRLTHMQAED